MLWVCIAISTATVMVHDGPALLPVFFGDISKMGWSGQFNLDFMSMLTLSGLWVAWRHHFSGAGRAFGVLALFGGAFILKAYLLVASAQAPRATRGSCSWGR